MGNSYQNRNSDSLFRWPLLLLFSVADNDMPMGTGLNSCVMPCGCCCGSIWEMTRRRTTTHSSPGPCCGYEPFPWGFHRLDRIISPSVLSTSVILVTRQMTNLELPCGSTGLLRRVIPSLDQT